MHRFRHMLATPRPLVVDVDGGLLATDPVSAGLRQQLMRRPLASLQALHANPSRPEFALQHLVSEPGAPLPRLPVRRVTLDAMELWQRFGAPLILISRLPEAMVAHLRDALCPGARLFGARTARPLDPRGKADLLEAVFGKNGFDLLAAATPDAPCTKLAHRAMLIGLTVNGKRALLTEGVHATALPADRTPIARIALRGGAGWEIDWTGAAREPLAAATRLTPERRPPIPDVSDAGRSRRGRAARS